MALKRGTNVKSQLKARVWQYSLPLNFLHIYKKTNRRKKTRKLSVKKRSQNLDICNTNFYFTKKMMLNFSFVFLQKLMYNLSKKKMCSPVVIKIAFITTFSNSSYYTHTSPPKPPEFFLKNHVKVKNFP